MGFSLGSIGTGLPKDIVKQLMAAERKPVQQLETRKGTETEKLKLVSDLQGRVRGIQESLKEMGSFKSFRDLEVTSSNDNAVAVKVDKTIAEPGEYSFEVVQLAKRASAVTNAFADSNSTEVGVGYITFSLADGSEKEIYIGSDENTLDGIAKRVNTFSKELGIKAQVINDGTKSETPYRLMFQGLDKGADADIVWPEFYFLDGEQDFFIESEKSGQNSIVRLDGFPIEFKNNQVKDLIPGVTISLKKAQVGDEITIAVKEDLKKITGKVKTLVESTNKVLDFITKQNQLGPESDTSKTLGGDSTLRTIESRIRNSFMTPIKTAQGEVRLSDVGLRFERSGQLSFSEEIFEKKLNDDFNKVTLAIVGTPESEGLASRLKGHVDIFTGGQNSILGVRTQGINQRVRDIDRQIETKERALEKREKNLQDQFARLETAISKLKSQGGAFGGGGGAGPALG